MFGFFVAHQAESGHVHHLNEIVGVEERFAEASQELTVFPPMVAALQQSTQQALLTLQVRSSLFFLRLALLFKKKN
jgi:hypothetical protein